MDGRMETLKLVQMIQDKGKSFLRKMITMDESAVCMLMPKMKMQLKKNFLKALHLKRPNLVPVSGCSTGTKNTPAREYSGSWQKKDPAAPPPPFT
jgi:hypothetical protein